MKLIVWGTNVNLSKNDFLNMQFDSEINLHIGVNFIIYVTFSIYQNVFKTKNVPNLFFLFCFNGNVLGYNFVSFCKFKNAQ